MKKSATTQTRDYRDSSSGFSYKEIFEKYRLDYSMLDRFTEKDSIVLCDSEEFSIEENWLKNYGLAFHLLPVFSDRESNFVGVYTSGFLKEKVACIDHDDIHFAPRFRTLRSFVNKIDGKPNDFDWHNLPDANFDYPNKNEPSEEELKSDKIVIGECFKLMKQTSDVENYGLLAETIINLTPHSEIGNLLPFLDDGNSSVKSRAAYVLGAIHAYEPAKEKIREIVKPVGNYYKDKFYGGRLFETQPGFLKRIFGIG